MINIKRSEHGQSIVILALVMVGLLAIAAVAVDGGSIFAERRRAQTAADNAAMAAAYAKVQKDANYISVGQNQAVINGFVDNGSDPWVEINSPPIGGQYDGLNDYIQVRITSTIKPVFSHFVFSGGLKNTVETVVKAAMGEPYGLGNAIVATSPTACNALMIQGDSTTKVTGAGIYSNSNAVCKNAACCSIYIGNIEEVVLSAGGISMVGGYYENNNSTVLTDFIATNQDPLPIPPPPYEPNCDGLQDRTYTSGGGPLLPGKYADEIKVNAGDVVTMEAGLYCLYDDFIGLGGSITGDGVMIYQHDGLINIGAGVEVNLTAPDSLEDGAGNIWEHMLIYMGNTNDGTIKFSGNTYSYYEGTIMALYPAKSDPKCEIIGNSASYSINSQIICDTVKISGKGTINIDYNVDDNYVAPSLLDLMK